jgi:UDP-N-acetylmuramoyl-tripeptide--D-alanyl-D-alanine ligase
VRKHRRWLLRHYQYCAYQGVVRLLLLCYHLREIASPDIAIVTNTLDAHIGEFGGFNNLVKAKGEIYSNHSKNSSVIPRNSLFIGHASNPPYPY